MESGRIWWLASVAAGLVACGGITSIDIPTEPDAGHDGAGGNTNVPLPFPPEPATGGSTAGTCGNGIIDGKEACDGNNLNGWTCGSATMFARPSGTISCSAACGLITAYCFSPSGSGGAPTGTGGGPGLGGGGFGNGGMSGSSGGSFGDPHIFTIDGLEYEFQAVGEFVLAEDPSDPAFVIQARQGPFGSYKNLAVNTAVATLVVGDRVTFSAGEGVSVRVDGVFQRTTGTVRLPHGGTLTNYGDAYVLTWPTGEELVILGMWKELLNVSFHKPPSGLLRPLRGLLGAANGRRGDDLTTRSGEVIGLPPPVEQIYGAFGDSWRVTDPETLFDYGPGENTDTFTDRSFPHADPAAIAPTALQIADARETCRTAGVTDVSALRACSLDVALTGNVGFARAAASSPIRLRLP